MLPVSGNTSPENFSKKLKSPRSSSPEYYFNFKLIIKPYSYVSLHPRSCLIIFILTLQISLLALSHYLPLLISRHHLHHPPSAAASSPFPISATTAISKTNKSELLSSQPPTPPPPPSSCALGKFYVYDLPAEFNVDIHKNCDKLSPWGSRCAALSNNGFGRGADGINAVIPASLANTWYWTDQFSSEIIFHNRLLNHKCRTTDPDSATAYYIPFYAGLAVGKYLWNGSTVKYRDIHCEMMLKMLVERHPYLNRSKGWDHFLVMGRITWDFRRSKDQDWGSKCIYMPSMRNITRLLIERNPWDYFDVGIPYPTGFHPNTGSDVVIWQEFVRSRQRSTLFCFAGATRGLFRDDFRGLLLSQCKDSGGSCRVVDCAGTKCANGTSAILETFLDSEFCLQPRGDSFTRRSIFDCMIAGSIPVFFWRRSAYYQYEWFLPHEPGSYSVFIHRNEVKNGTSIKSVLEKFSKEEVKRMREKVVEFIPKFIYGKPNEGLGSVKDAVDIAVDGVLSRIKEQREKGYDW